MYGNSKYWFGLGTPINPLCEGKQCRTQWVYEVQETC